MVGVMSSSATGGNLRHLDANNDRNVRFVLFTKTSITMHEAPDSQQGHGHQGEGRMSSMLLPVI